ncbi:MAG: glycoside hydrolase family 127 protein, partial [Planctomycetota bacterium]|nr:glycoside hydrolase family 127 protein [Planctomycetota bacterium]
MRYAPVLAIVCLALAGLCSAAFAAAGPELAIRFSVRDAFVPAVPEKSEAGYLATRMRVNLEHRLLTLNLDSILEPYEKRPGKQWWAGEHVGKFLHAAAYTWGYTANKRLKSRMDDAVRRVIATQLPNGYLGTYLPKDYWKQWDVWSHKYNLIGLLTYYEFTGEAASLAAARRVGDLLCATFGEGEGQHNIALNGTHVGMAPSSVLQPMTMLYTYTGEKKYLDFCRYIVKAWDHPRGPKILSSLLAHGNVRKTANNKAYEMLSCLVGLLYLHRVTGEPDYLTACTNAWTDVMTCRHYITGTTSWSEHFRDDYDLPGQDARGGMGEGCVTVTWLQLNWHLLRLTGEARYADEIERIVYNALLGAQSPTRGTLCYFTPLEGRKPYGKVSHGIPPDVCCCSSSLPRGIALIPHVMAGTIRSAPAILLYEPCRASIPAKAADGKPVTVAMEMQTAFPDKGTATLTVRPSREAAFTLRLRVPGWCSTYSATVGGKTYAGRPGKFLDIQRTWRPGDRVAVKMAMRLQVLAGGDGQPLGKTYPDKVAIQRGPQVLAVDETAPRPELPDGWVGTQIYTVKGTRAGKPVSLVMVPYADAGQTGGQY